MRRFPIYALMVVAVIATVVAFGQESEKTVRKLLSDQVEAWNAGNIEGYMMGYWKSDSTVFISGANVTHGYNEVLARYKKSYNSREKMGKLEFSNLQIRTVSSSAAIATGIWKLTRQKDQPWGRFTLIIEKKPEGWRIVYDHTSSAN
jgi:ketosteroid isomerase-like protein